jgi:hypothetical protein
MTETLTPFEERLLENLERHRHDLLDGSEHEVRPRKRLPRPAVAALAVVVALGVAATVAAATTLVVDTLRNEQPIWRKTAPAEVVRPRAVAALDRARSLILHVTVRDSGTLVSEAWYDAGRAKLTRTLRRDVSTGVFFSLGREQLRGRPVVHLMRTLAPFPPRSTRIVVAPGLGDVQFWLDAKTYLPVRKAVMTSPAQGGRWLTYDYEWLPRTPETLKRLDRR